MRDALAITRHYVDVGDRRVHYRRAGHGPPAVMLHASPRSSVEMLPLIERLGGGVTAFALDTPGYGLSDKLALERPEIADYADALHATLATLGITRAPVYGTHTGASIAYEFALRHPDACGCALLDGLPVFNTAEREEALAHYLVPFVPSVDGTHLAWLWARIRDQFLFFPWNRRGEGARLWRPLPPAAALHTVAMDILRAGDGYRTGYAAAFRHQPHATFGSLSVPAIFGARLDDSLLTHLDRLRDLPPHAVIERFSADRDAWGGALGNHMRRHAATAATLPGNAALPSDRVGGAYVDLPEGQLHVRGALGDKGLPLVLIHASPGGSCDFDPLLHRLAGRRPVLAPDLPGHGESDPIGDTPDAAAAQIDAALDRLGIDAAALVGVGIGTVIAATLRRCNPTRYRTCHVTDPPLAGVTPPGPFAPRSDGGHIAAAWYHTRDDTIMGAWCARDPAAHHAFGPDLDARDLHRTTEVLKEADNSAFRAACLGQAETAHRAHAVPRLDAEMLVSWGEGA